MRYEVRDVTDRGTVVDGIAIQFPERDEAIRLMPGTDGNYALTVSPGSTCFKTVIAISPEAFEELILWHRKRVT